MSTFKGVVREFPDIRIDYFRQSTDLDAVPPLACFLSHIHSDHLQGLESNYNAPFIYCSAATRELLVRLKKKTDRLNVANGTLETSAYQYKLRSSLLRAIPLETPTMVEMGRGEPLRVTLFDANHCVGSVMFLIEGRGKAVLYTGDIRAEDWWVGYIARHPVMAPYSSGVRKLDKIYLDTSWGGMIEGADLVSKRDGIASLLRQLDAYPKDTIFHLNTWTYGYEEVWVALASFFRSQIHLGDYHYYLFKSVQGVEKWFNGPFLGGFPLGNGEQLSVITRNPTARIHSCELHMECEALDHPNVVYITPTIGTVDGHTHAEVGIDTGGLEPPTPSDTLSPVAAHSSHGKSTTPGPGPQGSSPVSKRHWHAAEKPISNITAADGTLLPNRVTYPYARHSSLRELRSLVAALHPADVYQCVVDADSWGEHASVQKLFGDLCTGDVFSHDKELRSQSRLRYPSKNPESGGLKRSLSQEPETRLVGRDHEPESLLKKRRKVGAEKRSRTLGIVELLCEIGDDTLETVMVEEAVSAVLAGRWWGVELECTKRAWRYEPEVEL